MFEQQQQKKSISSLLVTFLIMVIGMSIYEALKQLIYPQITIWESHIVTITFSSTMATIAAYFIQRTYQKLQKQTFYEMNERKQAQSLLSVAYDDLEARIDHRTKELQKSNERLKEEVQIRKLTETKLRRSEERFSKVFHNAPLAIGIIEFEEGRIQMVNDGFIRLMECDDKDQVHGKTIFDLDMWVDDNDWENLKTQLSDKNNPFADEIRIRTILGEVRNILLTAEKINVNGNNSILVMLHDISENAKNRCRAGKNSVEHSHSSRS